MQGLGIQLVLPLRRRTMTMQELLEMMQRLEMKVDALIQEKDAYERSNKVLTKENELLGKANREQYLMIRDLKRRLGEEL